MPATSRHNDDHSSHNDAAEEPLSNLRLADFGEHLRGWRMALGLTAQQVAERADITRDTLRRIETGNTSVGLGNLARVLHVLGLLDRVVDAADPLGDELGRSRADRLRRKRVR
ncbi:helix-turn-helix domain-containing protein [Arachnia propionica]|uniref:Helix-turn-helix domain-containing protein n=1 Tax=Arachnia propionica TaxID=1750 RepID=A0A3P1WQC2_9ACTN|nr:helix-turn-helix domain-containing protein [Arachnia propionica]RRD48146.1 helix-turn-helix domain-containing protein [Arachnia propionica]